MPAKNLRRLDEEKTYCHIYNRGIEKRIIFNDEEDYEIFLGFLRDYLSTPAGLESAKKDFTVNGRIFRGIPHQPKNYFGKVELVAYSLMPDRFHLLLHQINKGSIESFMRSLSTRYSMYFNKKYGRTGTLFQGPYKSLPVKDTLSLLLLSRYFHADNTGYSSLEEYTGTRDTSWVKPKVVLAFFEKTKSSSFKGLKNYQNFVEEYKLDQKEKKTLESIIHESVSEPFEGSGPAPAKSEFVDKKGKPRIPEIFGATAIFFVLLGLGIRNINISATENIAALPTSTPAVLSENVQPTSPPTPELLVVVNIPNSTDSVYIRQEPANNTNIIGEAKNGEVFEFLSVNSGWYEIKLADSTTGFIWAEYTYLEETNN